MTTINLALTLVLALVLLLCLDRLNKRAAALREAQSLRERLSVHTNPREWRDRALCRSVDRLAQQIGANTVNALAQAITMADIAAAARAGGGAKAAEDYYRLLNHMAEQCRGNRPGIGEAELHQLIEAVLRWCAARLDVFPIEVTHEQ